MKKETAVLLLTHNCFDLTKKAVASILAQDVPVKLLVIDNHSTDQTREWLDADHGENFGWWGVPENRGVSWGWNAGLRVLLGSNFSYDVAMVCNNDTILPSWCLRRLLDYKLPFASGISVGTMEEIASEPQGGELSMHPDFSLFCLTRACWETVGPFDERMKSYASDNDWHVRAHRKGVDLRGCPVPFFHSRSSTLKLASPEERAEIESQANRDRRVFKSLYGCNPWDPEYEELFK